MSFPYYFSLTTAQGSALILTLVHPCPSLLIVFEVLEARERKVVSTYLLSVSLFSKATSQCVSFKLLHDSKTEREGRLTLRNHNFKRLLSLQPHLHLSHTSPSAPRLSFPLTILITLPPSIPPLLRPRARITCYSIQQHRSSGALVPRQRQIFPRCIGGC